MLPIKSDKLNCCKLCETPILENMFSRRIQHNSALVYYLNRHIRSNLLNNFFVYEFCEKCKTYTRVQSNKLIKKLCCLCSLKLFSMELEFIHIQLKIEHNHEVRFINRLCSYEAAAVKQYFKYSKIIRLAVQCIYQQPISNSVILNVIACSFWWSFALEFIIQ